MEKDCGEKGGMGDEPKRINTDSSQEVAKATQPTDTAEGGHLYQETGAGDGPAVDHINLCEGLSRSCSSDGDLCERAHRANKYNKEGTKRHSRGQSQEGVKMFEKAAENGSSDALFNLGLCHELGIGVDKDSSKAAVKYAQATVKDHKHAAFNLGMMNINGYCDMHPNLEEGVKYLKTAAELGLGKAATELGVFAVQQNPSDWKEAYNWFNKAANGNDEDPIGVLFLAHLYQHGHGIGLDESKATSLYKKAANSLVKLCQKKQCDKWLLLALGLCYEHGWGLARDLVLAKEYYSKSKLPDAEQRMAKLSKYSSEEVDLADLMKLVNFRPTAQVDGSAMMKQVIEERSINDSRLSMEEEDEDESWGSCSRDCRSQLFSGESSGESYSPGKVGGNEQANKKLEVSGESIEFM